MLANYNSFLRFHTLDLGTLSSEQNSIYSRDRGKLTVVAGEVAKPHSVGIRVEDGLLVGINERRSRYWSGYTS